MRGLLTSIILIIIFGVTAVLLWLNDKIRTNRVCAKLDTYYSKLCEKRKTVRLAKQLDVICKVTEKPDSKWSIFTKDISGEGVCLVLPEILPQNAIVDLEIKLPDGKKIQVKGNVVWIKDVISPGPERKRYFNAGIKFVKIDTKDKKVLHDYVFNELKT